MSWIKRNLYFLIGSLIALGLIGYGGYRLYSSFSAESASHEEVQKLYHDLDELAKQNPHPGSTASGKVDNVQAVKDQDATLRAWIAKARGNFARITPIPDTPKVLDEDFASQLRSTVAQLNRDAFAASTAVPEKYFYTFASELQSPKFDAGSLEKFAVELGEIKMICTTLLEAKINAIDSVQREVISTQDQNAQDYLAQKTMATPLGDIVPYRLVFRCFSSELATVLSSLANSPHGFIVKTINIEPGAVMTDESSVAAAPVPFMANAASAQANRMSTEARYRMRMVNPPPVAVAPSAATSANKPTALVNEHPLKVNLLIELIRLKSDK